MPSYCAFLGHQPHISLAELAALLPDFRAKHQWDARIVTFETEKDLTIDWLSRLGGTVLIAQEIQLPDAIPEKKKISLEDVIPPMLCKEVKKSASEGGKKKRKVTFSFRCLNVPRSNIRSLYRTCKHALRERETPSRYIGNERHPAKPGTLLLRGIPGPGSCELVILHSNDHKRLWIGKTCAVQDIEAYTSRDMGKPFRDTKTGLLPPKLAQVMLNLATITLPKELRDHIADPSKTWEKITLWDPFCGSGVILIEALLRKSHILGSDRLDSAIKGCKQNVRWLRTREKMPKAITDHVFKQNALKASPDAIPRRPTLIVTETSLGPALKKSPTKRDVSTLIRKAEELERGFFECMAKNFPEVPIVCSFPVYVTRDGTKHFLKKILDVAGKLGYRITSLKTPFHKTSNRPSLLYIRPDQYVGREIFCFVPPGEGAVKPVVENKVVKKTEKKNLKKRKKRK